MAEVKTSTISIAKKQYDYATLREIGKLPICHIRPPGLSSCCAIPADRGLREELAEKDIILSPPRKSFPSAQENKDFNKNDVFHNSKPRWDTLVGKSNNSNLQNKDRRFQDGQGHHSNIHEGDDRRFDRHLGRGNDRKEADDQRRFGTGDPRRDRELERQGPAKEVHVTQGWSERWGERPVAHPHKEGEKDAPAEAEKASHNVPGGRDGSSQPKPKPRGERGDKVKLADPTDVDAWFGKADPLVDEATTDKTLEFDLGVDLIDNLTPEFAVVGAVEEVVPKPLAKRSAPDANGAGGVASRFSTWFSLTDDPKAAASNGQRVELAATVPPAPAQGVVAAQVTEHQTTLAAQVPQAPTSPPVASSADSLPSKPSTVPFPTAGFPVPALPVTQALSPTPATSPAPPLTAPVLAAPPMPAPVPVHAVLAASAHAAIAAAPPTVSRGPTSPSLVPPSPPPATPSSPPLGHAPKQAPSELPPSFGRGPMAPGELAHMHHDRAGQGAPMSHLLPLHMMHHLHFQHQHQHLHQHQHQHQQMLHQHQQYSPQFMQQQSHPHSVPPSLFQHQAHQHLQHASPPARFEPQFRGVPPSMPPMPQGGGKGAPAGPPNSTNLAFFFEQRAAMQGSQAAPPNLNPAFAPHSPPPPALPAKQPTRAPSAPQPHQQNVSPLLLQLAQLNPQAQQQPMPQPVMGFKVPPSSVKEGGYDVSSLFRLLGGRQPPPGMGSAPQSGKVLTAEEFEKQFTAGR